jgi:oxygen-independent coproporphyrinogen-3 oxidase
MRAEHFEKILNYTQDRDFTSYMFLYPPMALWDRPFLEGDAFAAWKRSLADFPMEGIYVHIPFCKTKCRFCRYFSKELSRPGDIGRYVRALAAEMKILAPVFSKAVFRSVYCGGGSPSLLTVRQLEDLFAAIYGSFKFAAGSQVIFEANPEFLSREKLSLLKKIGVSRLTLGVQTQTIASVFRSYRQARELGIEHINVDLMCGLPTQSIESYASDLARVVALRPDVIHANRFTPTVFTKISPGKYRLAPENASLGDRMEYFTGVFLRQHGYATRDFDAWALSSEAQNRQLRSVKQRYASFLGVGSGAVSRASGYCEYVNTSDLARYLKRVRQGRLPIGSGYRLTRREGMINYILTNFRYGILSCRTFSNVFRIEIEDEFGKVLSGLCRKGALERSGGSYRTSTRPPQKETYEAIQMAFFRTGHLRELARRVSGRMR